VVGNDRGKRQEPFNARRSVGLKNFEETVDDLEPELGQDGGRIVKATEHRAETTINVRSHIDAKPGEKSNKGINICLLLEERREVLELFDIGRSV
jgi:hypothetical protein